MTKVLVTGGAGFIGSNIAEELVSKGFDVRILDNFLTGNQKNLHNIKDKIELKRNFVRPIRVPIS